MRYTLYTGEPALIGFMRTKPHATFWACFYALCYFLQVGWPASAGAAAGAIFYLFSGELAGTANASAVYWIGAGTFLACVSILLCGRHIERTLELLNWVLVVVILSGLLLLSCVSPAAHDGSRRVSASSVLVSLRDDLLSFRQEQIGF